MKTPVKTPGISAHWGKVTGWLNARFNPGSAHSRAIAPNPVEPIIMAGDPTIGRFDGSDEDHQHSIFEDDLSARLSRSAADIARARAALHENARDIQLAAESAAQGKNRLAIFGARFLIAAAWLMIAFWLNRSGLQAIAADSALTSFGMPAAHAVALGQTFLLVGGVAAFVSLAMIGLIMVTGNGSTARLRARAAAFGDSLADTANGFNDSLQHFQKKIGDGRRSAAQIVPAVSQAHLTALEARLFFDDVAFLTSASDDRAQGYFRDFLRRFGPATNNRYSNIQLIAFLILGFGAGAAFGYLEFSTLAQNSSFTIAAGMSQYQGVMAALLGGAALFVSAGPLFAALSGLFDETAANNARGEALDALSTAYLARKAPLASDVVAQVDNVVHILQTRLAAGSSAADFATGNTGRATDQTSDEPAWRKRDSSTKFVETAFSSAPDPWRTDAYAKKLSEKSIGEPGSKRSFRKVKKDRSP